MKTAAKVFIWIGMICSFYLVYPIIVGVLALKRLNEETSRENLKTMGILTLFFCSLLAGIFMLCMTDNGYSADDNVEIIKYEKKVINNNCDEKLQGKVKLVNQVSIYSLIALVVLSLIFSILPLCLYNDTFLGAFCVFFISIIILCLVAFMIVFLVNKQQNNLVTIILMSVIFALSIAVIVFSILGWCDTQISAWVSGQGWKYEYYVAWQFWVVFACSCLMTLISAFEVIYYINMRKKIQPQTIIKEKVVTSKLELELKEIKRLLDGKVISHEEYEAMRQSVIAKYYK